MSFSLMKELIIVRKAHNLVLDIYMISAKFPNNEQFGITTQLRRAAVSVPTNICEGKGRRTDADLGRFLFIAKGSLLETQYLLGLSRDLGYISAPEFESLHGQSLEVERMLDAMISKARAYSVTSLKKRVLRRPDLN